MATFTAGFSASSQYRLRLEINEGTIDKPNNRSQVSWALYVDKLSGSGFWTFNSGNSGGISGDVSGSANGWAPYDFENYTSLPIGSGSQWVTHGADGTKTATGSFSASDSAGGNFGSASGSYSITLSNTASAPNAPTTVVATRTSDSSIGLTWTPNPASGKPYNGQSVMVSVNGAAPTLVTNVPAAQSSYTFAATANRKYVFYIDASNAAGTTRSDASNTILTTPAALSSLTGVLVTPGTIRLTLPVRPTPYTEAQVVITETHDGGSTWNAKTTLAMSALSATTTTTWDDTSAQTGGTVQYRAQVQTNGGTQGLLSSGFTLSNTLILNTPPGAPTNLAPSGPVDASNTMRLSWVHSPSADGAAQSSRRLRYSTDGGSSWSTFVSGDSTLSYYDWSPNLGSFTAGQTIIWQVATAGSEPGTYGAWSASQSLTLYGSLAIVLTADNPPTTHEGGPLPVAWTSSPTWGTATQSQYRVTMTDQASSQIVFDSGLIAGVEESLNIPSDVQVNEHTYTVTVTLVDNHAITSQPASRTVTMDYLPPGPIGLVWSYDDQTATLMVTPTFTDASDEFDETAQWALERSLDGETWVRVGEVVGANPISDVLVRVGASSFYRGVPTTALGISVEGVPHEVPAVDVTSRWGWLTYGDQNSRRVRFGWSQTVDVAAGRASSVYDVEGVEYPVAVFGGQKSRKVMVAGKLIYGDVPATLATASGAEMVALQENAAVCVFRDARGEWWHGRVTDMRVSPARAKPGPSEAAVSFTIERVTP